MLNSEIKYTKYSDIPKEIVEQAYKKTHRSPYRQHFHIEPDSGYLNDPNGISYYNGKYHLFYQWSPLRYNENPKIWYQGWHHLESEDLINWKSNGAGIEPDSVFDTHGPYSGSALEDNGQLIIFYTGNTRDENWIRTPYQVTATMDKTGQIQKSEQPGFTGLIEGYTDHFRDPKIWKENNMYYAIVGIQRVNKTGAAVLLKSIDAKKWEWMGEIKTNYSSFGYMWECPDYFELQEQGVLLFSPQGIEPTGTKYQNIYQTGYLLGEPLNLENLNFEHNQFQELDLGFDFYAAQTFNAPDGRRILVAWMGLPEIDYPTEEYGYCGCLTIPRVLSLKKGKLIQKPVGELQQLRYDHKEIQRKLDQNEIIKFETGHVFELKLTIDMKSATNLKLGIRSDEEGNRKTVIDMNVLKKDIVLDRSRAGKEFATDYGTKRTIAHNTGNLVDLHVFVDQSSIEIFVNNGEYVSSSRIFPDKHQKFIFLESINGKSTVHMNYWKLKNTKEENDDQH